MLRYHHLQARPSSQHHNVRIYIISIRRPEATAGHEDPGYRMGQPRIQAERASQTHDAVPVDGGDGVRGIHSDVSITLSSTVSLHYDPTESWCPSRKQYDYQFRKWGLQKYGLTKTSEDSRTPSVVQSNIVPLPKEEAVYVPGLSKKRAHSVSDTEVYGSGLSSSLPSPSKKVKVDDADRAPQHANAGLIPVSSTPTTNQAGNRIPDLNETSWYNENDQELRYISPTIEPTFPSQSKCPTEILTTVTITTLLDSSDGRTEPTASSDDLGVEMRLESMQRFEIDQSIYHQQLDKVVHLAQSSRQFLTHILITNMLNEASRKHLLTAADYLDAVMDKNQSFAIYEVLLAAEQAADRGPVNPWILSPVMLSCARAAETTAQRKIVKEALLKRIGSSEDHDISPSENSLAQLLLEQMVALDGQDDLDLLHSKTKWNTTERRDIFNTSFDVLAYLHSKSHESRPSSQARSCHSPELVGWDAYIRKRPSNVWLDSVNERDLFHFAMRLRDGSRSITPVSEHVRPCLDWCIIAIDATNPALGVGSIHSSVKPSAETPLPDTLSVYNFLHEKLRRGNNRDSKESIACWSWAEKTRETLGISSAELLFVCCDMVMCVNKPQRVYACDYQLRQDFEYTNQLSNEKLVTRFLQRLYLRVVPLAWTTRPAVAETRATTENRYEPTMASSIRSSNPSYRRMRDAAASILKRRFSPRGSEISFISREKMASVATSIDNLSDLMRDSLSISDRRE